MLSPQSPPGPPHSFMFIVQCVSSPLQGSGIMCLMPLKFPETSCCALTHIPSSTHLAPCCPRLARMPAPLQMCSLLSPKNILPAELLSDLVPMCILDRRGVKTVAPQNGDSGTWLLNPHLKEMFCWSGIYGSKNEASVVPNHQDRGSSINDPRSTLTNNKPAHLHG